MNETTEKLESILIDKWFKEIDFIDSLDTGFVNGYNISVNEDSYDHSEEVTKTINFRDYDTSIKIYGTKEVSYERWVDTDWNESWDYV